jgi:phosphonoacetaldehyde hydrolase
MKAQGMRHVKAVIFDWAGTVVDYGSLAPMGAFVETFAEFGVAISIDEARGPMGMAKRPHIAALVALPRIAEAWRKKHGHPPTDKDIDALYDVFVPKNVSVAADYADLIPGIAEVVRALRAEGVKIGSSTGYTREIMARIAPRAAERGFAPDSLVCTGDTAEGRPSPLMLYKGLIDLGVWPAWSAIKVDDTTVGVAEGVNGGAWAVGVAVSGNCFGLSLADVKALASEDFARRRARAEATLYGAGAHYVIDSAADLMPVVARIEGLLARGERP